MAIAESVVLEQIRVRLVSPEDGVRWDRLMTQHHLKSAWMVGEQSRYVAEYGGV